MLFLWSQPLCKTLIHPLIEDLRWIGESYFWVRGQNQCGDHGGWVNIAKSIFRSFSCYLITESCFGVILHIIAYCILHAMNLIFQKASLSSVGLWDKNPFCKQPLTSDRKGTSPTSFWAVGWIGVQTFCKKSFCQIWLIKREIHRPVQLNVLPLDTLLYLWKFIGLD